MSKKIVVAAFVAACVMGASVSTAHAANQGQNNVAAAKLPALFGGAIPQNGPPGPKPPPKKN